VPGVYLSFPFCAQKCSFCNFASGVFPRELERDYIDALRREIRQFAWEWTPETVYIGGGTPSRLDPADLRSIVCEVPGRPWREATIEAAPGSVDDARVSAWRCAGINRVSLGVQSFVTRELRRTGRRHDGDIVARDIRLLRDHGIDNINIDLIAGLPGQTVESWNGSLDAVEQLGPPHVSVYIFEVDEDSRLGTELLQGGTRYDAGAVPSPDLMTELYEIAVDRLGAMGIERYEISNFARPGFESLHNVKYWLREPYAGFGADAHSFDGRSTRRGNVESAAEYVSRSREGASLTAEVAPADPEGERFYLGLRLMRGIQTQPEDFERHAASLERLTEAGLLEQSGSTLRLTRRGVLLSNEVFQEFVS
jgi:oxygen-independent coproporphyrinogen-3 oxidase